MKDRLSVWKSKHNTYVVAEAGLNHNGDFDIACELVDIASWAGADAIKFQKRDVETLAVGSVLDSRDDRFPSLGSTYREIRERHEFDFLQFEKLKLRASQKGLDFFVTPFDLPSLGFLGDLGVDRIKVASHSVTNLPLLERIADGGKPVLLSSGMATQEELDSAVELFLAAHTDLAVLHCVSSYPTRDEDTRLDLIREFIQRYQVPVGYSGHEVGFQPTLFAVAAGASLVERHLTLDNEMEGFDHGLSLNPHDFREMVTQLRILEKMFPGGPKVVTEKELLTRQKYQVSMVSKIPISEGQVLTEAMVVYRNPGTGIPPASSSKLFGRAANRKIPADVVLSEDWFA